MMSWYSIGPYLMFPQAGSFIVSHVRYALSRHSSSHAGSAFLAEIRRTMSSFSPRGAASCSTSVMKPYLYSRFASSSMVCVEVLTFSLPCYTLNETPHPHVLFAFGLLKTNPLLNSL